MHLLERIARKFNEAGIPLMLLKGAALNLTVYRQPHERTMGDLDLMVKPEDARRACELLEAEGALRRDVPLQDDFFPRFHFEKEYSLGSVLEVPVDLHVRPFCVLRYSRLMPEDAFWDRAVQVRFGGASALLPSPEDMLIHLTAHCAFHGCCDGKWLEDIARWSRMAGHLIGWDLFIRRVRHWRLSGAVLTGLIEAERLSGPLCPPRVRHRLSTAPLCWRDRLVMRHARRGDGNLLAQAIMNVLTTPGPGHALAYLRDLVRPNREYMDDWCMRHRFPWRGPARLARCIWPLLGHLRWCWEHRIKIEIGISSIHGLGVFARRELKQGETIARYRGGERSKCGTYDCWHTDRDGRARRHSITGPLRHLNHSCQPNARLDNFTLIALRPIRPGHEITIDYGTEACLCRRGDHRINSAPDSFPSPAGETCSLALVT